MMMMRLWFRRQYYQVQACIKLGHLTLNLQRSYDSGLMAGCDDLESVPLFRDEIGIYTLFWSCLVSPFVS